MIDRSLIHTRSFGLRAETLKVRKLWKELEDLKARIFPEGSTFSAIELDDKSEARYSQLLGFFYPEFQTEDYQDPMEVRS